MRAPLALPPPLIYARSATIVRLSVYRRDPLWLN